MYRFMGKPCQMYVLEHNSAVMKLNYRCTDIYHLTYKQQNEG
jgi:hypothetical protein